MADKLDLKKTFKHLYNPSAKAFTVVDVPSFSFLMVDAAVTPTRRPNIKRQSRRSTPFLTR